MPEWHYHPHIEDVSKQNCVPIQGNRLRPDQAAPGGLLWILREVPAVGGERGGGCQHSGQADIKAMFNNYWN